MIPSPYRKTGTKVKRRNLIFARTSSRSVYRGHTLEKICDDGCKSQEIQSEILRTVPGQRMRTGENGRNNMYVYFKGELHPH